MFDLSDNTNLFGSPPAAMRALRDASGEAIGRYPTAYSPALRAAIAAYVGVRAEEVTTGSGSDDVLDAVMRAFAEPGDAVAFSDPTFSMIPKFAGVNGLVSVAVPLRTDGNIDAAALIEARARITYVCTPNNPTGGAASAEALASVLAEARGIVLVDEAYAEFAEANVARCAPSTPRLVVVRTLSKAFGLAGIRVGYGIGAAPLVAELEKVRAPYRVSAIAEQMAIAALANDVAWVRERATEARELRARFASRLRAIGLEPLRSDANFLLVPVDDARAIAARVAEHGIAVRALPKLTGIGDAVRIGIAPWPIMEKALRALEEAIRCA